MKSVQLDVSRSSILVWCFPCRLGTGSGLSGLVEFFLIRSFCLLLSSLFSERIFLMSRRKFGIFQSTVLTICGSVDDPDKTVRARRVTQRSAVFLGSSYLFFSRIRMLVFCSSSNRSAGANWFWVCTIASTVSSSLKSFIAWIKWGASRGR